MKLNPWCFLKKRPGCFLLWTGIGAVTLGLAVTILELWTFAWGWRDESGQGADVVTPWLSAVVLVAVATALVFVVRWHWLAGLVRRQFTWRQFKLYLKGVGVLAVLAGLFYVEKDVRGWYAWRQCRQELEASGEHLDFACFIPPPVPDDQNFAMAPIWAAYQHHAGQPEPNASKPLEMKVNRFGVLLPGQAEMSKRPFYPPGMMISNGTKAGARVITNDFVFIEYRVPRMGRWMLGEMTDIKGWQYYYRLPQETNSSAPPTNEFPVAEHPQSPAADVLLALSKYGPAIEVLREAGRRPFSRFPLNYAAHDPDQIVLSHLQPLRECARVLQLRTSAELAGGQPNEALADLQLMFSLANSLRGEPDMLSQSERRGLVNQMIQPVWEGLARRQWSDEQLVILDRELAQFDVLKDYSLAVRAELAARLKKIELLRSHRSARTIEDMNGDSHWYPTLLFHLWPAGWFFLDETLLAQAYAGDLPTATEMQRHVLSRAIGRKNLKLWGRMKPSEPTQFSRFWLVRDMFGGLASQANVCHSATVQAAVDMARIGCALERFRRAQGEYPATLAELSPQYLQSVPNDIINGEPLHYRRTGDGRFVLYSVGWDEKDDGGVPVKFRGSDIYYPDLEKNKGDWVWRYPEVMDEMAK